MGTRGLPFLDLFFSGIVGKSQLPCLAVVLEKVRLAIEVPFCEVEEIRGQLVRVVQIGLKGVVEAIESLSN